MRGWGRAHLAARGQQGQQLLGHGAGRDASDGLPRAGAPPARHCADAVLEVVRRVRVAGPVRHLHLRRGHRPSLIDWLQRQAEGDGLQGLATRKIVHRSDITVASRLRFIGHMRKGHYNAMRPSRNRTALLMLIWRAASPGTAARCCARNQLHLQHCWRDYQFDGSQPRGGRPHAHAHAAAASLGWGCMGCAEGREGGAGAPVRSPGTAGPCWGRGS